MNHLSEAEIFSYIDGRTPPAAVRRLDAHCADCARCRQQVEFHRALARSASQPQTDLLADGFTERVMRRVHVPRQAPRFSWALRNSANIIAMAVVLGILIAVGYLSGPASPDTLATAGTSVYANLVSAWHGVSSSTMNLFTHHTADAITPVVVAQSEKVFGNAFWLGAAAFLLLALADRLRHRVKMQATLFR